MWTPLLLISLLSIAAVGFVVWPLFRPRPPAFAPETEEQLAELLARKESTLQAIRELEFDHSVGKIDEADFEHFNRILRRRAIELLRRIDDYAPQSDRLGPTLEEEIAARRRVRETNSDESRSRLQEE